MWFLVHVFFLHFFLLLLLNISRTALNFCQIYFTIFFSWVFFVFFQTFLIHINTFFFPLLCKNRSTFFLLFFVLFTFLFCFSFNKFCMFFFVFYSFSFVYIFLFVFFFIFFFIFSFFWRDFVFKKLLLLFCLLLLVYFVCLYVVVVSCKFKCLKCS